MRHSINFKRWSMALFGLLLFGCGDQSETPVETVKTVFSQLNNNKPGVVWQALPVSYQNDINTVVHAVAGKMDEELYNKGLEVLGQAATTLKNKKTYFLNHPMWSTITAEQPLAQADLVDNWDSAVSMIDILLKSEIANVTSLKTMDVGQFMRGTLAKIMTNATTKSPLPYDLSAIEVELISTEGDDSALLKITPPAQCKTPTGKVCVTQNVPMTRVEGKWLPQDMVTAWQAKIAQLKAKVNALDKAQMTQQKPQMLAIFALVGGTIAQIEKTQSQEAFNAVVNGLIGMVMQTKQKQQQSGG